MTHQHAFILTPGEWLGEGKITFSASPDVLTFHTKWVVPDTSDALIHCAQLVEVVGGGDPMNNSLILSEVTSTDFKVILSNELVKEIQGTGVIDSDRIAWEFRGQPGFEGFEVYELQDSGEYLMHAEYMADEQYRTHIDGRIWKKAE